MRRNAGFYRPSDVIVTVGAPQGPGGLAVTIPNLPEGLSLPFVVSGFAEDAFISAVKDEDDVTLSTGSDGESVNVVNENGNGTITMSLKHSSISNVLFSSIRAAFMNKLVPLAFVFPIEITDVNSSGTVASCPACTIRKIADFGRGANEGDNEWIFNAPDIEIFHAGRVF